MTYTFDVEYFKSNGTWYDTEQVEVELPDGTDTSFPDGLNSTGEGFLELREQVRCAAAHRHPDMHAVVVDKRLWFPLMVCADTHAALD